jgi:hypothetical protein
MDNSLMMALFVINSIEHEGRSALPDAPVVTARRAGSAPGRRVRLQGWLAGVLHHAALAIEPDPQVVSERRRRGPAVESTSA